MISKDKQYRTRDGREVRIYATDGVKIGCIHGAIKMDSGWRITTWDENGAGYLEEYDLIEIRPRIKREYWLALYNDGDVCAYRTEEAARNGIFKSNRIALVKRELDCEEGEGL